jgi:hypothetical protein
LTGIDGISSIGTVFADVHAMHGEGSGNWRLDKSITIGADWCSRSDNGSYLIRFKKEGKIAASKGAIEVSDPIAHEIGGTIHLWCEYSLSTRLSRSRQVRRMAGKGSITALWVET